MILDPARSTPFGFRRFASEYLRAARAVHRIERERTLYPLLYLYGLAIELALKAFLLKRGNSLAEMKGISHGLAGLLALARRRKLGSHVKLATPQLQAIRVLDVTYSDGQLRYIYTGMTVIPEVSVLASAAEAIVRGVEYYCTGYRGHV